MSNTKNSAVTHTQNPDWEVMGRYEDFESADFRRQAELARGRASKVHRLSTQFVVKSRQVEEENVLSPSAETHVNAAKPSKPKRQDRDSKR